MIHFKKGDIITFGVKFRPQNSNPSFAELLAKGECFRVKGIVPYYAQREKHLEMVPLVFAKMKQFHGKLATIEELKPRKITKRELALIKLKR